MNTKLYIMGAAAAGLLVAGSAQAAGGRYAEPSQPVAYSKLNSYMKASPSKRASGDWTNTAAASSTPMASTGNAADTAATVPAQTAPAPTTPMDMPAPTATQPGGSVNAPPSVSEPNAPMQAPAPADASGQTDGSSPASDAPATK